jgi:hypothetical protein
MTKALVFKYWEDGIQIFSCKWYLYIDWQRSTIRRGSLPDHQEAPELYDDLRTHWIINRKIINFHKWGDSLKTIDPPHLITITKISLYLEFIISFKSHNLSTRCVRNRFVASLSTRLLFYHVATRLSLTTCWQIVELQDDNKLLEQLVTSLLSSTTL